MIKCQMWLTLHMIITSFMAFAWTFANFGANFLDFKKVYQSAGLLVSEKFEGINVDDNNLGGWLFFETLKIDLIVLEFNFCLLAHIGHLAYVAFSSCSYHLTKSFKTFVDSPEFAELAKNDPEV